MIKPRAQKKIALDPMVVCKNMFIAGAFVIPPGEDDDSKFVEIKRHYTSDKDPEYIWGGKFEYIICAWGMGHVILYEEDKGYARISDRTRLDVLTKINKNFKQIQNK